MTIRHPAQYRGSAIDDNIGRKVKFLTHFFCIAVFTGTANHALAQMNCEISPEKKVVIESILCGQAAQEVEYRQYGQGCFKRSVEKRLEDSAIQITAYEKCEDPKFSAELEVATIRVMRFMDELSVCVSERVNIAAIMKDRMDFARRKSFDLSCTPKLRAHLQRRKPAFKAMIQQSTGDFQTAIFEKLGVFVDDDGNVWDR
ncbi:hypothetical protein HGD85_04170 [Rhodobacteraceae bacterium R_SAG10]|nr:hypothetical protein [Rhodobacteraceae bacterium R_SAG10]